MKLCKSKVYTRAPNFSDYANLLIMRHKKEVSIEHFFDDIDNSEPPEIEQIKQWAVQCKVLQSDLRKLMNILRVRLLPQLPKSPGTLLGTSTSNFNIQKMEDATTGLKGEFVYFGIAQGLTECVDAKVHVKKTILLMVNIDGVLIFKSSTLGFWPILCRVFFQPDIYQPFPVAIYCGKSKPKNVDEFLIQFVLELNHLLQNGITIDSIHYQVALHSIICDKPARAFIKGIKGHTAYSSRERCQIVGYSYRSTMIFPHLDQPERTDNSFRNMLDPDHHNYRSPLLDINPPIDMVKTFSLDLMHLVLMGVMKALLNFWILGKGR